MPGAGWSDWWGRVKRWRAVLRRVVVSWDGKGLGGYGRRPTQVGLNYGVSCDVSWWYEGMGLEECAFSRKGRDDW